MLINGIRELNGVRIIDIGKEYGNMNTASSFYPKEMTLDERQIDFLRRRLVLARECGFDGKKMFMADQTTKDGSYCVLTKELIEEKDDGWLRDIPEDILILTKDTPGVVIGHPVADCPVIIMSDKSRGVTALGHCNAEMVDKKLPISIFKALEKEFGSTTDDVKVYISSCISEKWEYDCYPKFANDKMVWEGNIFPVRQEENKTYYGINIRGAISRQLDELGIAREKTYWNMDDTLTDDRYYSNSGARNNIEKKGRNFVGAYYSTYENDSFVRK